MDMKRLSPAFLAVVGASALLAGCVAAAPTQPDCDASGLQSYVGEPRSVLAAMTLPAPVRIIEPGMVVTMEFNPKRLNFVIGEDGRIERIYCG